MLVSREQHQILKVSDTSDFSKSSWLSQIPVPNNIQYTYRNAVTLYVPAGGQVSTTINIVAPVTIDNVTTYVSNLNITKFEVINYSGQLIFVSSYSTVYSEFVGNTSVSSQIQDFVYEYDNLVPETGVLYSGQMVINVTNFGSVDTTVVINIEGLYSYYNIGRIPVQFL